MFQTIHTVLVKQAVLCLHKKVNVEPSGSIFLYIDKSEPFQVSSETLSFENDDAGKKPLDRNSVFRTDGSKSPSPQDAEKWKDIIQSAAQKENQRSLV